MDIIDRYKDDIMRIDSFVKTLDPAVRGEAFRILMEVTLRSRETSSKTTDSGEPEPPDQSDRILRRLSAESGIPVERLMEVYDVKDSVVYVIDSSIPNTGPTDFVKKITLLCSYGNIVGRGTAKVERSAIYKNLKELKAATTAYSRDVKATDGVKVLADRTAMLAPDGRQKAQALLKDILKV